MVDRPRPRDVSTVISIVPIAICEKKPGLQPSEFRIPAVEKEGEMQLLVVERCIHAVYLDEARPRLVVPDPSDMVAESIVNDYKQSMHGYVEGVAEPGIAWVYGEFSNDDNGKRQLAAQHRAVIEEMVEKQMRWFATLVEFADDDWGRYRRHIFITPQQRIAAQRLGLERDWLLQQEINEAMNRCPFCFQMVDPRAIICSQCKGILDKDRYKKEFVSADEATKTTA